MTALIFAGISPTVIAVLTVVLSPLVAYLVAARKLSGRVATSEATDLWEESRSIREDYATRIRELNETVAACSRRIDELERSNRSLYLENGNLKRMIEEHEQTISELRTVVHRLSEDNDALRADNKRLKDAAKETP